MEIKIKGMACEGYVNRIKEGLEKIEGVEEVELTLNPPRAKIKGLTKEKEKQVLDILTSLGYEGEVL